MLGIQIKIVVQFATFCTEARFGLDKCTISLDRFITIRDLGQIFIQYVCSVPLFIKGEDWFTL